MGRMRRWRRASSAATQGHCRAQRGRGGGSSVDRGQSRGAERGQEDGAQAGRQQANGGQGPWRSTRDATTLNVHTCKDSPPRARKVA